MLAVHLPTLAGGQVPHDLEPKWPRPGSSKEIASLPAYADGRVFAHVADAAWCFDEL